MCSLRCRSSGIDIREIEDIMLPAFLSSVNSTSSLINSILSAVTSDFVEVVYCKEGIEIWNSINSTKPINAITSQRNWDEINISRIILSLNFPSDQHNAIFIASLTPESKLNRDAINGKLERSGGSRIEL